MKTLFNLKLILIVLIVISCQKKEAKKESSESFTAEKVVVSKNAGASSMDHIIPVSQGIEMYEQFYSTRTKPIQPTLRNTYKDSTFVDTKFVHFSIEDIKNYLAFIEKIQKENPEKDVSGLRVYFGAYPNEDSYNNREIKHPGQQTVFITPTVYVGEVDKKYDAVNHLPFYVEGTAENPNKGQFLIIEDLMIDYKKSERLKRANSTNLQKASFFTADFSQNKVMTSTIFNEGQLVPPPIN